MTSKKARATATAREIAKAKAPAASERRCAAGADGFRLGYRLAVGGVDDAVAGVALVPDEQQDVLALGIGVDLVDELLGRGDGLAVDLEDDVAGDDSGVIGGAAGANGA